MMLNVFSKLYGNAMVFKNLPGQRHVPYFPREKLWALRDKRLRRTVHYAAKTVPYYQQLFQKERIDPHDIKTVEDLEHLPLIDKEMVRKSPHLFVSTSRKGKTAICFNSSGSSGSPLKIYHDQTSLLANIAFGEREREVLAKVYTKEFGYKEAIIFLGRDEGKVHNYYKRMTFIPVRPDRLRLSVSDPIEDVIQAINHFRPDIIRSFGSYLETLFRILALRQIDMNLPRMLIYGGDSMTRAGRHFIEEHFGIPVLSTYQATEAFKIGFFCEERRGFHLHEDLCHVKIVNAKGEKVENGQNGEVVISNLINRGTVLLNYPLGDFASILSNKCSCGRILTLLSEVEGRVADLILLPNGGIVHPGEVWRIFKGINEVLQYQLIQHDTNRFELRLATINQDSYHRILKGVLTDLRNLLGHFTNIEAEYYQELGREYSGKFRPVISYCKLEEFI